MFLYDERKRNKKLSVVDTGIEVVKKAKTPKRLKTFQDLDDSKQLASAVNDVIDQASEIARKEKATLVWGFEVPVGSQSARANRLLGIATGILAAMSVQKQEELKDVPLIIVVVRPSEVKTQVGNKDATKDDVMRYIKKFGKLKKTYPKSKLEHIADALVIAEIANNKIEDKE